LAGLNTLYEEDWGSDMPKFLERKLKQEYGAHSDIPYRVMNKIGAMRGNKETAKGRAMAKKHRRDTRRG